MDKLVSDINLVKKDIETIRRNICGYIENSKEFKNMSVCKNDKGYIIKAESRNYSTAYNGHFNIRLIGYDDNNTEVYIETRS